MTNYLKEAHFICIHLTKTVHLSLGWNIILIFSNGRMYTFVIKMVKLKCPSTSCPACIHLRFVSFLCSRHSLYLKRNISSLPKRKPAKDQDKISNAIFLICNVLYTRMELVNIFSMANKFIFVDWSYSRHRMCYFVVSCWLMQSQASLWSGLCCFIRIFCRLEAGIKPGPSDCSVGCMSHIIPITTCIIACQKLFPQHGYLFINTTTVGVVLLTTHVKWALFSSSSEKHY